MKIVRGRGRGGGPGGPGEAGKAGEAEQDLGMAGPRACVSREAEARGNRQRAEAGREGQGQGREGRAKGVQSAGAAVAASPCNTQGRAASEAVGGDPGPGRGVVGAEGETLAWKSGAGRATRRGPGGGSPGARPLSLRPEHASTRSGHSHRHSRPSPTTQAEMSAGMGAFGAPRLLRPEQPSHAR